MFKIFKDVKDLEQMYFDLYQELMQEQIKRFALEDYLDIEFFHGDKSKPHYRKKRVIKKPVGRPRKKK